MKDKLKSWFERPFAAFIYFTRLPFWRLYQPSKESYASVVEWWPLTGWLTGGLMALVVYFGNLLFPHIVTVVLAIALRMMLTGAMHEDGLADFFDGFGGGGRDRQRILDIMKDSRIGTYGVIALMIYVMLLFFSIYLLPTDKAALCIFAADPFSKMVASQLVMMLPYARSEQTAKSGVVYRKPSTAAGIGLALQGLLPLALFLFLFDVAWEYVVFVPAVIMYFLYRFIWQRLRGYTGDCCGAVCLLVELSVYLVVCSSLA